MFIGGSSQFVDGRVGGNTVYPGGKFGLAFKAFEAAADLGENFLYAIFSFLISEQSRQIVVYFRLEFFVDFVEFQCL